VATEEQRGGDSDGDRGAAAKAALARAARQGVAVAGFAGLRARGGGFIGWPRGHGVRARGIARAKAGLMPQLDSGSNPSQA
jgi:hypothetical protein